MMPRAALILLVSVLVGAANLAHPAESHPALVISHVTVIDTAGGPSQSDMTVVVKDQHIADVAKSADAHLPAHAVMVDGRGKYLIPGLWDMHVHTIFGDWLPRNEKITLPLFVAN